MKLKIILSFLLGRKRKEYKIEPNQSLSEKINNIEYYYINLNFSNFYRFCIGWCLLIFFYFTFQSLFEHSYKWKLLILMSGVSSLIYFFLLRYYVSIDLIKSNFLHKSIIVFSAWLLTFNQYLFIHTSHYSDYASLHTVTGIVYGLFIALFYFLPDWKITILSSFGSLFFLLLHYYNTLNSFWYVSGNYGNINEFYMYQIFLEFLFVIIFIAYANKRREEKHKTIKEVFLKKLISNPHLKMMDSLEKEITLGNWLFKAKTIFSDTIGGADLVLYEEYPNGDLVVAIGDVIGHGLDVSSGSFVASTSIKSLVMSGTPPLEIFNVVNNILCKLDQEEGGEIFLQLIICKPNGEIFIYGSPAGETKINEKEIDTFYAILGKEKDYLIKDEIIIKSTKFIFNKGDFLFSCTDGWKYKDEFDDRSYVRLQYVGDN